VETSADDRRSAFQIWMRTGRWPGVGRRVEVKFNPNHDELGRFTTAGGGLAGDVGRFGGGGATGSWSAPVRRPAPSAGARSGSGTAVVVARARLVAKGRRTLRKEKRNGYAYLIDDQDRTRYVIGAITLASRPYQRSRTAQANAGGADRAANDDGGHYIAARFNGPTDAFNHFAQNRSFNRGAYAAFENILAKEKIAGNSVSVTIVPKYFGNSQRPSMLKITYRVNGKTVAKLLFDN